MVELNTPPSSESSSCRMIAPAALSLATIAESSDGIECWSAIEPAVVASPWTSIVSSSRTGMPCSGPRTPLVARSASSVAASSIAFVSIARTAWIAGPSAFEARCAEVALRQRLRRQRARRNPGLKALRRRSPAERQRRRRPDLSHQRLEVGVAAASRRERRRRHRLRAAVHARVDHARRLAQRLRRLLDDVAETDEVALESLLPWIDTLSGRRCVAL